ncbi:MAG TPA: hypothetical protein VK395_06880 [Gemmataceae bacterium]|nr:hypothetical protein [Gemmataceae bacterium]
MQEFLSTEHAAPAITFIALFICVTIIVVGCTVAVQWRKLRQAELTASLKKQMLDRGASVEEIQAVLQASEEGGSVPRSAGQGAGNQLN